MTIDEAILKKQHFWSWESMADGMWRVTLKYMWHQIRSTPWVCDGVILGTIIGLVYSTCALAFSAAFVKFPDLSPSALNASRSSKLQHVWMNTAWQCHECNALRLFGNSVQTRPIDYHSTIYGFFSDTLVTETFMSFVISFIVVSFAVFVVREIRWQQQQQKRIIYYCGHIEKGFWSRASIP